MYNIKHKRVIYDPVTDKQIHCTHTDTWNTANTDSGIKAF